MKNFLKTLFFESLKNFKGDIEIDMGQVGPRNLGLKKKSTDPLKNL
jgi:hypothetical protein